MPNQRDSRMFKKFINVFERLPIAALIDDKIFCVHGGISQELTDFHDFDIIQRPTDIPEHGLLCDLLWSDPQEDQVKEYEPSERGVSYSFNDKCV